MELSFTPGNNYCAPRIVHDTIILLHGKKDSVSRARPTVARQIAYPIQATHLWGGTFASNIMIDQIPAAEFYLIQGNAVLFSEGSRDLESHG